MSNEILIPVVLMMYLQSASVNVQYFLLLILWRETVRQKSVVKAAALAGCSGSGTSFGLIVYYFKIIADYFNYFILSLWKKYRKTI